MTEKIQNSKSKNYSNSPIDEAVFDIRVTSDLKENYNFDNFYGGIKSDYPNSDIINILDVDVGNTITNQKKILLGKKYWSSDGKKIVACKKDGLAFSRKHPYGSWNDNYQEMISHWKNYKSQFPIIKSVNRIAVRFINKLPILKNSDIKDYFNIYVNFNAITNGHNKFSYTLQTPFKDNFQSIINFHSISTDFGNNIIFDIDVFLSHLNIRISQNGIESEIEDCFQKLRKIKNKIFEDSITDRMRDTIK